MTTSRFTHLSIRFWMFAAVIPLAMLSLGAIVPFRWQDELPALIPHHWGSNGPDAFGTLGDLVWPLVYIGGPLLVGMTVLFAWVGKDISTQRIGVVTNNFLGALFAAIPISTAYAARGLEDASQLDEHFGYVALGAITGVVLGALLAWALPKPASLPVHATPSETVPRQRLSDTESGVWVSREISWPMVWVGGATTFIVAGALLLLEAVPMLVVPLTVLALMAGFTVFDIRVDDRGVSVKSALKFIKREVPLHEIIEADTTHVNAMKQFGGFGFRTALDGTVGIILRSGEALELKLSRNRRFVVTMKRSAEAAGLVNTLVERSRT
jgi:hypothetical protein